jgi:aspartate kinase
MGILVQKYGGSSLATAERIRAVAARIIESRHGSRPIVVVVSAMGDTTDELINLANQLADQPDTRELDLLLSTGETISCTLVAMTLRHLGFDAISLTGAQAGIRTDTTYSRARIVAVDPSRIHRELAAGRIVVVAGFQGMTDELDVTTLGRGGSDTTAVAMAAILKADFCEIYTDVDGVLSADPRIEPHARKIEEISYEEMLELAQQGAKVMHPRAVELGSVYGVPIHVRSSFNHSTGTLIHGGASVEVHNKVRGIAHDSDVAKITVQGVPDRPGIAAAIFQPLADANISVDVIVQNASVHGITDLSFTVARPDLNQALRLVQSIAERMQAVAVVSSASLSKVSIVGTGMQHHPGYAARMFSALSSRGINIEMITTSEIRITCLIDAAETTPAVQALHEAFQLDRAEL